MKKIYISHLFNFLLHKTHRRYLRNYSSVKELSKLICPIKISIHIDTCHDENSKNILLTNHTFIYIRITLECIFLFTNIFYKLQTFRAIKYGFHIKFMFSPNINSKIFQNFWKIHSSVYPYFFKTHIVPRMTFYSILIWLHEELYCLIL